MGWSDEDDHGEVDVDLDEHSAALLAAIDEILPMLAQWLAEMTDDDPDKSSREAEYRLAAQFKDTASMEQGR